MLQPSKAVPDISPLSSLPSLQTNNGNVQQKGISYPSGVLKSMAFAGGGQTILGVAKLLTSKQQGSSEVLRASATRGPSCFLIRGAFSVPARSPEWADSTLPTSSRSSLWILNAILPLILFDKRATEKCCGNQNCLKTAS